MGRIADGIPAEPTARPQRGCLITKLMNRDDVDDDDRAMILAKLRDPDLSDEAVSGWFLNLGDPITASTIRNHRRGLCCYGVGKVR